MELTNSSLIAVVGPTGAGKSALAVALAKACGGEIVNFDSVQVYRGLDIGSAKTPISERNGVPHHLIDILAPNDDLTAGGYADLAQTCLRDIASRHKTPILVGGTGFYLRSLLDGLSPAPSRKPDLRQRLNRIATQRPAVLHRFLSRHNPAAAGRIHPNDHQKLIRAIELSTSPDLPPRRPLTGFSVTKIGLNSPRPPLYDRINQRTAAMFAGGLLEEAKALLESGIPPTAKSLQTLGYKQAIAVLEGKLTLAEAIKEVQTKTRQYAKRQMTWFRRENDVQWLNGFGEEPEIQQAAIALTCRFSK